LSLAFKAADYPNNAHWINNIFFFFFSTWSKNFFFSSSLRLFHFAATFLATSGTLSVANELQKKKKITKN